MLTEDEQKKAEDALRQATHSRLERFCLKPEDYPIDLSELDQVLTRLDIDHTLRPHPAYAAEKGVKAFIGYSPAGEWQVLIDLDDQIYSVIRGLVSFGYYEIMNITGGPIFSDPERFETPQELVDTLLDEIK